MKNEEWCLHRDRHSRYRWTDSRQHQRLLLFVISRIYEYMITQAIMVRVREDEDLCAANGMNGGSLKSDNATTRMPNNGHNKIA